MARYEFDTPTNLQILPRWPEACKAAHVMPNSSFRRQILPAPDDDTRTSGVYSRHIASAPTLEMPCAAASPASLSVIRRIQVEYVGSPSCATANDVDPPSFLINTSAPNSTAYCFIAPRIGSRRR